MLLLLLFATFARGTYRRFNGTKIGEGKLVYPHGRCAVIRLICGSERTSHRRPPGHTPSTPSNRLSSSWKSVTLPSTHCTRPPLQRDAMFSFRPVEKLSRMTTSCPSSTSRVARWEPMKPAPPVTMYRISDHLSGRRTRIT